MTRPPAHRRPFELHPVGLAVMLLGAPAAFALPQGAVPTFGQTQTQATAPGQLTITQGSTRAGIDWTSFSIAAGERVLVLQPGRDSVLVNRVVGNDPSQIFGQLQANGSVWLVNPRGIVFGAGSRVDVGGLVATTLDVRNADSGGRLELSRNEGGSGEIRSEGQITARDGSVVMVAPRVTHIGTIEARRVGLAAATDVQVDVEGDGLIFFNVRNDGSLDTRLSLLGNVLADGGSVEARAAARAGFADTVLNLDGIVQARSLGQRNGRVVVDGGRDGITVVSGRIDVSGANAGERGGDAVVTGQKVGIASTASVDASGHDGGGRIRVGGGWQGADGEVPNAEQTNVQRGARLDASATQQGDGGAVVVWSDHGTRYAGHIDARGGAEGGNGGNAEVSGKDGLAFDGSADLRAPRGADGLLLLDPTNITISDTGTALTVAVLEFDPPGDTTLTASSLVTQLQSGNVELNATNNITVGSNGGFTSSSGRALTLRANNDINISAAIEVTGGVSLIADANAAGGGSVSVGSNITVGSGATALISTLGGNSNTVGATVAGGTTQLHGSTNLVAGGLLNTTNVALDANATLNLGAANRISTSAIVDLGSGSTLNLAGAVTLGALSGSGSVDMVNNEALTVGSAASTSFSGIFTGGNPSSTLVKTGTTTFTLTGASTGFTGKTTVSDGVLVLGTGGDLGGAIEIAAAGATLRVNKTGSFTLDNILTGTGTLNIAGGTIAVRGNNLHAATLVTGGSANVDVDGGRLGALTLNGGALQFGADNLTIGSAIALGINGGTLDTNGRTGSTFSGSFSGGNAFTKSGSGTLIFTAAVTGHTGDTRVSGGTLALGPDGGPAANLADASTVTVDTGATLRLVGNDTIGTLQLGGTLASANAGDTLTATTAYTLTDGAQVNARLGAGTLTSTGTVSINRAVGATTVNVNVDPSGGSMTLGAVDVLDNAANVSVASGATLTLTASETVGTLTLAGTLDPAASAHTLTATTVSLQGGTVNANLGTGAITSTGDSRLNGTAAGNVTVTAGTLTLGGANRLADGVNVTVQNDANLTLGGADTVNQLTLRGALTGSGTLTATTGYTLDGTTGTASTANGADLGIGTLTSTGTVTLAGKSAAGTVNVDTGTLTLTGSERLATNAALTVAGPATLTMSADQSVGTLAGAGTVNVGGARLTVANASTFDGTLAGGAGGLTANASFTLNGTVTYAGTTSATAGVFTLGSADRLNDASSLDIGGSALLALNGNETVKTFSFGGTGIAGGTGTLTATDYAISGGTIDLLLGTGTLTATGGTLLAGIGASAVNVTNNGTLVLANPNLLSAAPTLTVDSGATLQLNGNQTAGTASITGRLAGGGTLTTTTATLHGGAVVDANLGSGNLVVDGAAALNGTSANPSVAIANGGTLTLGGAERLLDSAVITVAGTGTLAVPAAETIGTLTLSGTLAGAGTLTAGAVALQNGALVSGQLGAGPITSDGNTRISGTVAGPVTVRTGTLRPLGDERIADSASVTVEANSTLLLGGTETVAAYTSAGELAGNGTLVSTAGYALNEGASTAVGAGLGAGTVTTNGGVTLRGAVAGNVSVQTGTLTLDGADRLADSSAVTVANTATLTMTGNQRAAAVAGFGDIEVGTATLTVGANGASSTFDGRFVGTSGGVTKAGTGTFVLVGTAGYSGATTVDGGTLLLNSAERLADGSRVVVGNAGTLTLNNAERVSALTSSGTVNGAGTLSATTYTLSGGTVSAGLGGGTLSASGGTLAGSAAVNGVSTTGNGTLVIANTATLTAAPTVNVTGGSTLQLDGNQSTGATVIAGRLNGSGTLTTTSTRLENGANVVANLGTGDLTVAGNATLAGTSAAANVTVNNLATLTLASAERLGNGANLTVLNGGTLTLPFDETVGQFTLGGRLEGAGTLGATGVLLTDGANVAGRLGGGAITSQGAVTISGTAAGNLLVQNGILTLATPDRLADGIDVTVANGATLRLGGNETVNRLVLAGTLANAGTLSAGSYALQDGGNTLASAHLGAGTLTSDGTTSLTGSSAATSVSVDSGTLTLVGANRFTAPVAVAVADNAVLTTSTDQAFESLGGNGTVSLADARLTLGAGGASSTFGGSLTGGTFGGLTKLGSGSFTLAGSATYGGETRVTAGALVLPSTERLADGGRLVVGTNGTLTLAAAETVGQADITGRVDGAGTLNAPLTVLDGGTVAANLGGGTLRVDNGGRLDGQSAAAQVDVVVGTLVLGSGGRFSAAPALSIGTGTTLQLGGNESAGSATIAGTLAGSAATDTLTAPTTLATGANVLANLGAADLNVTGAATLAGSSAAALVTVQNGGALRLATAERLADGARVDVRSGGALALAAAETIGRLDLAGTLNGPGKLTAGTYALAGGTANADLGAGTLRSTGPSTLNGHADALTVIVENGTLTLGSAERLADSATVSVARNARLTHGGDEKVGTLSLAGSVDGIGTLSADAYVLDGGVIDGDIAGDRLTTVGDSTLNGESSVTVVNVDGGTLSLGSAGRFTDRPDVTVAAGAAIVLGGNEAFGSLAGAGTADLDRFTLTTGSRQSSSFSGALVGSGALLKVGELTTFTLGGANPFSGALQVNQGTLALADGGTLGSGSDVTVATGATLSLAGNASVDTATLRGTLAGTGTLTAATYTLEGGHIAGRIGAGALTNSDASRVNGDVCATTVNVLADELTLASAGRLAPATTVVVADGARLTLGGDERVAALTVFGTLGGSGTLTTPTVTLDGGNIEAALGGGALTSHGSSRLAGSAAVDTLTVADGTLSLVGAGRLGAAPATTVNANATLALGGDETLGTLAGGGRVELGSFTLATGRGGDSTFDGELAGSGGLAKQGSGRFTLSGRNTYTGRTTVADGTLVLADGSTLATSAFTVDGTLRVEHDGVSTLTLAQDIGGSGSIEKDGSGRLVLDGSANTYSGATRVLGGELATVAAELLPDASDIVVAAGARLTLGGAETVNSIASAGEVGLSERFTTRGAMVFDGPVRSVGGAPLTLQGTRIEALDDGNDWGSRLSLLAGGSIDVAGGRANDGRWRDLTLGEIDAGGGGRIVAGNVAFDGLARVTGGTLAVESQAAAGTLAPDGDLLGRTTPLLRQIAFTEDSIVQNAGSRIEVADGALLSLTTPNGGSIRLLADDNRFAGGLEARSGGLFAAWAGSVAGVAGGEGLGVQSRIRVAGDTVRVGGAGLEADVIAIRADRLSTAPGATIAARLPFDNLAGIDDSVPALTLELTPEAFTLPFPFGQNGGSEIAINVGGRSWGSRTLPLDSGYITVLPRGGAAGATAVVLSGPLTTAGYRFFFDGAGKDGEIPVFYNGVLPATPQVSGSISATVAVSEGARKERFDDSVRTENVAVRLRAGVIAEVGPGRPATVGSEGVRTPATCPPSATLGCEAAN